MAIAKLDDAGLPHTAAEEAEFAIKRDIPAILFEPLPLFTKRVPNTESGWNREALTLYSQGVERITTRKVDTDGFKEVMTITTDIRNAPKGVAEKATEMLQALDAHEARIAEASADVERELDRYMEQVNQVSVEVVAILAMTPDTFAGLSAKAALLSDSYALDVAENEGRGLECLIADIDRIAGREKLAA